MKLYRTLFSAVVLASGALAGARALAEGIGLAELRIGAHLPDVVILEVLAGPELEGMPAMIKFGPAPFSGPYIGAAPLHGGWNYISVPNPHEAGWYTVQTASGLQKTTEDDQKFFE